MPPPFFCVWRSLEISTLTLFLDFQPFLTSGNNPQNYRTVTLSCSDVHIYDKRLSLNSEEKNVSTRKNLQRKKTAYFSYWENSA